MRFLKGYFQVLIFSLIKVRSREPSAFMFIISRGYLFYLTTHKRRLVTMQRVHLHRLRLATLSAALAPARSS